ncbi:response regulator [Roseibium sediminis]|uniref:response regulator n=1 Tax=Roseibium sediminis TaxID=1775174 RepID=UPI00123DD14E|nr:response regulator transcription factor [Roseibium sediminis]
MKKEGESQDQLVIKSVLVIDDHPLYCDALAATLEKYFRSKTVRTATSLKEGLRKIGVRFQPDLVVLDLRLPDVTGLSGFIKVKNRLPDVPVLVVSADSSDEMITALTNAGAAGFLPKDASHKVLQHALSEIREGRRFLPPGYKPPKRPTRADVTVQEVANKIAELTPQQNRIMKLICDGKPNKQIAYELSLAEATVKAHITALLRRLGVNNRTQAALLVRSASLEGNQRLSDADTRALLS